MVSTGTGAAPGPAHQPRVTHWTALTQPPGQSEALQFTLNQNAHSLQKQPGKEDDFLLDIRRPWLIPHSLPLRIHAQSPSSKGGQSLGESNTSCVGRSQWLDELHTHPHLLPRGTSSPPGEHPCLGCFSSAPVQFLAAA